MAEAKTITVKLVLDTTEWDAALARVKAGLEELGTTLTPKFYMDVSSFDKPDERITVALQEGRNRGAL